MKIPDGDIRDLLLRIDAKLDSLLMQRTSGGGDLPRMTIKQHACLQMLLGGASNAEIAERFGVTENTAKVHVRTLAAKFGVHTRSQIILKAKPAFDALPADEYRLMAGGLPKDWHARYRKADPHKHLYFGG